jgi:putative ABC transport system permease protein
VLFRSGDDKIIKGVIKNAHTKSLHQDVVPQIYLKLEEYQTGNILFFKIAGNPQKAIHIIEQKWKEREPEYLFEYHFLDDAYQQLYRTEMNAGKVFSFAMLITLMITVAGLFAMTYYAVRRRVREIALRKIHGATVKDIFVLLNRDFLLLVVIAFAVACPVAYYGMRQWLDNFAVKTELSVWVFVLAGTVALAVALLTTGWQTWKAATANPVNALKAE